MGICLGCREVFNKKEMKEMKNGYCKTCFENLNLKDNSTISLMNITDQKKEEEEKKHYIKVIVLLLTSLGIIGVGAYTLGW